MTMQLTLNMSLDDTASFQNFYPGDNHALFVYLQFFIQPSQALAHLLYLWGFPGSGRSHLLQACCHAAHAQGLAVAYLPLREFLTFSPEILQGIEAYNLVCIDDVDVIVGQPLWEEALFHCYNRLQQTQARLIVSGSATAAQLNFCLPDLQSRLVSGVTFQVKALSDEQKLTALQLRAAVRGLDLSEEVGQFLLHHYARDMVSLFHALERLDQASLIAKRKLTIPFIKQVLML